MMPPQAVMQARARSVNATGNGASASKQAQLRAKFNKSSLQTNPGSHSNNGPSFIYTEKNRASTSQGKHFNFVLDQQRI